jgi:hypothetical protein
MPSKREYRTAAALYSYTRARDAGTTRPSLARWAERRQQQITRRVRAAAAAEKKGAKD